MIRLIADSGSTKTVWALVELYPGLPKVIQTALTVGLNPLYVTPEEITAALKSAISSFTLHGQLDQVSFYGSGCSGERRGVVEQALRRVLTPMTKVEVESDLLGAALALSRNPNPGSSRTTAGSSFIACIMGTGSIAAHFDPRTSRLQPMPALGYVLGDEGSGAWFGRQLLSDYLKEQMPDKVLDAFEEDYGEITVEQAIRHVYQLPCPNRYLATFASFLGRHPEMRYVQELAFKGIDAFWRRNVMRVAEVAECDDADVRDVRLVGSVAWHLRPVIEQVAESHGYVVTQVLKDPIDGLV